MNGTPKVFAWVNVSSECLIESRVSDDHHVDFALGTWQGGVELTFERCALERFVELATAALNQPVPGDPKAA